MDQKVSIIHQNPFAVIVAFDAGRQFAQFFYLFVDVIANRTSLARIGHGTDHKEVSKGCDGTKVKYL